jgi:sec-independent protein translocase protein TatA
MTVFGMITPAVAVILLVVALIIFGPGKLPELGRSLGRGIKEFKDATDNGDDKQQLVQTAQPRSVQDASSTETKAE